MPPPAGKKLGKKLPLWAWIAAGAIGLLIGWMLLRRQASAPQTAAQAGQPSTASLPAPADSTGGGDSGLAAGLAGSLAATDSLGNALAAIAANASTELSQFAQTATAASLGLAGQAVQSEENLASNVVANSFGFAASVMSAAAYGSGGPGSSPVFVSPAGGFKQSKGSWGGGFTAFRPAGARRPAGGNPKQGVNLGRAGNITSTFAAPSGGGGRSGSFGGFRSF